MSSVSNWILTFGVEEDENPADHTLIHPAVERINQELHDLENCYIGEFVRVDGFSRGLKVMETNVYLAVFNYGDPDEILSCIRAAGWHEPQHVQVFVQGQHDDRFGELIWSDGT